MRYYVSWKTIGYYRKDSLKLAARCPVSGCWPCCLSLDTSAMVSYRTVVKYMNVRICIDYEINAGRLIMLQRTDDNQASLIKPNSRCTIISRRVVTRRCCCMTALFSPTGLCDQAACVCACGSSAECGHTYSREYCLEIPCTQFTTAPNDNFMSHYGSTVTLAHCTDGPSTMYFNGSYLLLGEYLSLCQCVVCLSMSKVN